MKTKKLELYNGGKERKFSFPLAVFGALVLFLAIEHFVPLEGMLARATYNEVEASFSSEPEGIVEKSISSVLEKENPSYEESLGQETLAIDGQITPSEQVAVNEELGFEEQEPSELSDQILDLAFFEEPASKLSLSSKPLPQDEDIHEELAELASPDLLQLEEDIIPVKTMAGYTLKENERIIEGIVKKGDTVGIIFDGYFGASRLAEVTKVAEPIHDIAKIKLDKRYTIVLNEEDKLIRFEYERSNEDIFVLEQEFNLIAENGEEQTKSSTLSASLVPIEYTIELAYVEGTIELSLFDALLKANESVTLASSIVDIFSYQIDFFRDMRKGDSFKILVEKKFRDGEFKGYGNTLAAFFVNKQKEYCAYQFIGENNARRYYDAEGNSLENLLLRAPLDFTRISSGYTLARKHPILGVVRPHQGIDYAAPTGTPVHTVGDGVVTFVGTMGGYGKTVIVKHSNGLESQYAHLSKYNKIAKKGARVNRGDTIAYVGSTGLSTGPHLDFRIKLNGEFINPDSVTIPKSPPLVDEEKVEFSLVVATTNEYLSGAKALSSYTPGVLIQDEE